MPKWSYKNLVLYLERQVKRQHDAKHGSTSERPSTFSATPATGTHLGGTSVVITGRNFSTATAVDFGATPAASYTIDSDTQITAVSPAHAAGAISLGVTNPYGSGGVIFTFS